MNGQRLRPLGLGDIFDEGFDLYKRNFVFLLLVTAIAVVPLDIGLAFLSPYLMPAVFDLFGVTANTESFLIWFLVGLTKLMLFFPLLLLAVTPLVSASGARYMEREVSPWAIYRAWLRRLPAQVLTLLMVGAALNLSLLGCLVCWIPVAGQLFFTLHTFTIEGKGPGKDIGRSSRLVSGYGGRVANCLILLALIAWVISLGVSFPLAYLVGSVLHLAPVGQGFYGGAAGVGQTAEGRVVTLISSGLAHLVLIPFLVCVMTVLYYDLRIRKEGFDVELLAEGLHYAPLTALGPFLPPAPVYGPGRPGFPPHAPAYGYPRPGMPPTPPPGPGGPPR